MGITTATWPTGASTPFSPTPAGERHQAGFRPSNPTAAERRLLWT
uniref:Uncharacterized protein n=1 Tax=Anguilla anguilla TaxID=7936 RepID=A0A0E9RQM2_ANGAN